MGEQLIELGLLQEEQRLVDRLLVLVAETAVESDTLRTAEFREKLEKFRKRITLAVDSGPEMVFLTRECLSLCQDYFRRAKRYLLERETEFAEVIEVLRDALGKLTGEAKSFNSKLLTTSDRFNRLTEIQDIRELKKQISQEVRELNRVVVEKQKQDEASYAKLSRRIEVLQANLIKTQAEASLDALTRVSNRGAFDRAILQWTQSHKEKARPFVLAMLDLDNFKTINDTHGHTVGDRVLLCAAQWLGKCVRSGDFLARYGGEEFAILLAETQLVHAEPKFIELLSRIANCSFEYSKDGHICEVRFTVSCGLAEYSPGENFEDLIRRADEALYEAKRTGKNKVVLARKQKSFWQALKPFGRSGN